MGGVKTRLFGAFPDFGVFPQLTLRRPNPTTTNKYVTVLINASQLWAEPFDQPKAILCPFLKSLGSNRKDAPQQSPIRASRRVFENKVFWLCHSKPFFALDCHH